MAFDIGIRKGGLATLAILMMVTGPPSTSAPDAQSGEIERSVLRALQRLPYYGVFDFIVFSIENETVKLAGYSHQGTLRAAAEMAVLRVRDVKEVANRIEVLPGSPNDDRIRWATFFRIYADDFLSRYAPGGIPGVLRELRDEARFPGMQPVGIYPIHIVVKDGRTLLLGTVDSAIDRQLAEVRAREVPGVFDVVNRLSVDTEVGR